ncbi:hypothetical protein CFBP498_26360 [Xanthomonas hortorum pv. vitians]|uniref:Uncharacterized protein n=2 Tax=Xanthomonas hortorum TaxID=56454 RepID=A0A6V7DR35_9XANT|nr:hypothetical protein [Xanthomonas hortorum]MCE4302368.1 hypothetical protein [Xanthomonas hortorum pv. vitians]MDT7826198.1 hypothetical protein [Xanthomonas hortorum pv. vitians]MDV7248612.1 hypothetical protein [Xanthomonas hortorum pv. vitians]NMI32464.1 hypothetical protein [Xanthomonas hortorum pv. vitians]CAD0339066.1 hypothetical protein CFBP498_26360 [Xanthomonas hortorum pv. vitians]
MSRNADLELEELTAAVSLSGPATRRCLCACAAADHAHAKALKRRGMSKGPKRYPKRSDRIELTGLRAEAASRDFVRELRA